MQDLLSGRRRLPEFSSNWIQERFGQVVSLRKERTNRRTGEFCVELEHIGSGTGSLVGQTTAAENTSKAVFAAGDVLFGRLRAYLRKYWIADRSGVCSTEIWVMTGRDGLRSDYLCQVVQTGEFIDIAITAYGTHMPRSDWNAVKNWELSIPSTPEEQEALASILAEMDAEIVGLADKLAKARQIKQGMMQNLLTGKIRLV